jgi:hypothetical protein
MFIVSNLWRLTEHMYRAKLTHLREEPSASPPRPRDLHAYGRPKLGQKGIRKECRGGSIKARHLYDEPLHLHTRRQGQRIRWH